MQAVVDGDGGAFDSECINGDVLSLQYFQRVFVAGGGIEFASVADDENNSPPRRVALGKIARGPQDGVIQDMRFSRGSVNWRRRNINLIPVDDWAART